MQQQQQQQRLMDPVIWGQLPDDLLDRILALLPLRTILTLRPTCKRFHSLLLSPSFLSLLLPLLRPSPAAFLMLSHPQFSRRFLPLYSSSSDAWRTAPLPPSSATLLSSSSGLLLFSLPPSSSLLVSNPLTAASRLLSSPIHGGAAATATTTLVSAASPRPHGYHVFLPDPSSNYVFLYDSGPRSWSRFPSLPGLNANQEGVPFAGSLYFTTLEPFSVVGFHLAAGRWDTAAATPALPGELAFIRLVGGGGGRLFLVGGVGSNGISRSLRVWEMVGGGGGRWEEVGRLPEMMCRKFGSVCYHNYGHVYCTWHEGLICVCCTTWPEVLLFKVARGVWHWLPRCPLLQEKWSCGFRWFSFVPDLCALV